MVTASQLSTAYNAVKKACQDDWLSDSASNAIIELAVASLKFLTEDCEQVELHSLVPARSISHFHETAWSLARQAPGYLHLI